MFQTTNTFILALISMFILSACSTQKAKNVGLSNAVNPYPPKLEKVFERHGGLDHWNEMNSLSFKLTDPEKEEQYHLNLKDRRERIEGSNFTMASDGTNIWIDAEDDYTGNPKFYSQLMFYFYAMPFVLGDDGILYSETPDLVFEGQSYPGFRISYNDGVGLSSKDEYFIHYHPETYRMEWLGYTVTYFSNEKSSKIKWIRYDDWAETQKLILPASITWYKLEDNKPLEPRNTIKFEDVKLSKKAPSDELFRQPKTAKIVE